MSRRDNADLSADPASRADLELQVVQQDASTAKADGDRAFEALVQSLAGDLLAYFTRRVRPVEDAADLLSECLVVLWRAGAKVPAEPRQARLWVFGVARKVLSTHRRTHLRRAALLQRVRGELAAARTWVDGDGAATAPEGLAERAGDLVRALAPPDREIFMLVHWEQLTLAEVAEVLGMPPGTVRSRYSRARSRLRDQLSGA